MINEWISFLFGGCATSFIFYVLGLGIVQPKIKYFKYIKQIKKIDSENNEYYFSKLSYLVNECIKIKPEILSDFSILYKDLKLNINFDGSKQGEITKNDVKRAIINMICNLAKEEEKRRNIK